MRAKVNSPSRSRSRPRRAFGVNMSRVVEAVRQERNRQWREENRDRLNAYAREVEREGLPLARFRSF